MKGIIYIFLDNYVLVKTFTMEMASLLYKLEQKYTRIQN